jgi:hypothetical protein
MASGYDWRKGKMDTKRVTKAEHISEGMKRHHAKKKAQAGKGKADGCK